MKAACALGLAIGVLWAGDAAAQSPGARLRDCADCPELIVLPGGVVTMAIPPGERRAGISVQRVAVSAFALGVTPVTFAQWDACVAAGGCAHRGDDFGWGRGDRPVIGVSWADAQAFVRWLSDRTGRPYRLPSEAEWEYAARAGTATAHWWGDALGNGNAACGGCGSEWDGRMPAPVASFRANPFGLYDMQGNAWQWLADCWAVSFPDWPADARARENGDCTRRAIRGGDFASKPDRAARALPQLGLRRPPGPHDHLPRRARARAVVG